MIVLINVARVNSLQHSLLFWSKVVHTFWGAILYVLDNLEIVFGHLYAIVFCWYFILLFTRFVYFSVPRLIQCISCDVRPCVCLSVCAIVCISCLKAEGQDLATIPFLQKVIYLVLIAIYLLVNRFTRLPYAGIKSLNSSYTK